MYDLLEYKIEKCDETKKNRKTQGNIMEVTIDTYDVRNVVRKSVSVAE